MLEGAGREGGGRADVCRLVRGGKWVRSVPADGKLAGGRSDACSVADVSGCQEYLGSRKRKLRSSSEACLKLERVTGKRGTWRGVKT